MNFWVIAPGDKAKLWDQCKTGNYICIGWEDTIADINKYNSKEEIKIKLGGAASNDAGSLWSFGKEIMVGDIIIAKSGEKDVVGLGIVISDYIPANSKDNPRRDLFYRQIRKIKWIIHDVIITMDTGIKNFWIPTVSGLTGEDERIINILEKYNITITDVQKEVDKAMAEIRNQKLINILEHKHQIILQGPPGTGKTFTAEEIAYQLIFGEPLDISKKREEEIERLSKSDQYKFIQFHPAYSYEDFVRGITAKSNGTNIEYKTENKHLAEFAKKANENFINSKKDVAEISKEKQIEEKFQDFIDSVQDSIDKTGKFLISEQAYIFQIDEDSFRYKGDNWATNHRMPFSEVLKLYNLGISGRKEIKEQSNIRGGAKQHATYYFNLLQNFKNYLNANENNTLQQQNFDKILPQNFILIIDEINRANLPAVLGELIYALEYRDNSVESIYDIEGDRKIVLPKNLFIIGTMNTADRSVGHIDYAIRRRFAFETIFPQRSVINSPEGQILFDKVAELFCENYDENKKLENEISEFLSGDFLFQDVMIGHSYFMGDEKNLEMKLEYEIKPILREYLKDGILSANAKTVIEGLNV